MDADVTGRKRRVFALTQAATTFFFLLLSIRQLTDTFAGILCVSTSVNAFGNVGITNGHIVTLEERLVRVAQLHSTRRVSPAFHPRGSRSERQRWRRAITCDRVQSEARVLPSPGVEVHTVPVETLFSAIASSASPVRPQLHKTKATDGAWGSGGVNSKSRGCSARCGCTGRWRGGWERCSWVSSTRFSGGRVTPSST